MNIDDVLNECKTKRWESLNISHRGLVVLPARIAELITLKKLFLNNNHLILPPEEKEHCVEDCHERHQAARDDPSFMSRIFTCDLPWMYGDDPEMKQQSLQWKSPSFPCPKKARQILHLEQLEELCLDQNQLTVLPNNIISLKHLTYLGVNHNPLSVLPEALGELRELRELWAINCGLISIPPSIGKLGKLQKLGLSSNSITTLPPQFGNLKSLQWLNLADNKIEDVPENLKNLQSVVFINLNKNSFKKIPKALIEMTRLQVLLMNFNSITSLEDDLVLGFSKLLKLDLRQNTLTLRPRHWKGLDFILLGSTETSVDDI